MLLIILATTDFHGDIMALRRTALKASQNDVSVVIVCGDITHFGSLQRARELLSILNSAPCPVLFVPGNCDPPELAEENIEAIECLHGKCRQIDNINFFGAGGSSPTPLDTPFELSETEIADILKQGFEACQNKCKTVLVSHSPPKNTSLDITFTGEHVGSSSVKEFIEKKSPQLVLCGHIHEAVGVDKIKHTIVVNPGPARHGQCVLIELSEKVNAKFTRL